MEVQDSLFKMRHSAAHIVAAAVEELYPNAQFGVGPVVENGFFYDIKFDEPISEADLLKIEKRATKIVERNEAFVRTEMPIDEAIEFFRKKNQIFKVELLEDLKKRGTTKMNEEELQDVGGSVESVSVYTTGKFVDLCRGPHVEKSKEIGPFKLNKLAGAYWRGKSENPQLQRIYGVCFATQAELDEHLAMLEEAKKRDHRKIGQDQELFFIHDMVGKGLVLWLPNGTLIRNQIEAFALQMEEQYGYQRVVTPHMGKEELYLTSGHLPYYKESMYPAMEMDDGVYYLKAMNCPHHHLIYNHTPRSYRDLPVRLAEYAVVYRNELSGTLAGLLRVRGLAQNDAHLYCRKDQIKDEFKAVLELNLYYFKVFGFKNFSFRLSKWDPAHLDKYINEPENWKFAEGVIREVLQEMNVPFVEVDNEAAFYGPKVDVQFKSVVGREETMSTIQLDFAAKKRFGLTYVDETGKENNEVFVIHRAPLSTHERFTAFLIEHYAGVWPVWLAPVQVALLAVSEQYKEFTESVAIELRAQGVRVHIDASADTIGKKIRNAETKKTPYMVVVGEKEKAGGDWQVRVRGQKDQEIMSKVVFVERVLADIKEKKIW